MLKKIILNNNKLTKIPKDLFKGLYNLTGIYLCSNLLTRLPAKTFAGLTAMETLELRTNPLLSLEIEEMKKEMPKLRSILLRDLELTCGRLTDVYKFCGSNSIAINTNCNYQSVTAFRTRPYTVQYYSYHECLSEEQHEREVLLRETFKNNVKQTSINEDHEIELRKSFDELKEKFAEQLKTLGTETRDAQSTYLKKVFDAQNFMLKLLKDKLTFQESKLECLNSQMKKCPEFDSCSGKIKQKKEIKIKN